MRKKEMLPFGSWIDLEGTLLSEIILISQKNKYYISPIYEIFKKKSQTQEIAEKWLPGTATGG